MDFFDVKIRDKTRKYSRGQKRGLKKWRRVVSAALCIVLFSTNMMGVVAAEVSDKTSMTEIPHIEEDNGQSSESVFSDTDFSEETTEYFGETGTGEFSTPSDVDTTEDVFSAEESMTSSDENEVLEHSITNWTWVDEEEILTEYNGAWYLSLPGADMQEMTPDMLQEILPEMLPKQIRAVLSNDTEQSNEETLLDITWDFSALSEEPQVLDRKSVV